MRTKFLMKLGKSRLPIKGKIGICYADHVFFINYKLPQQGGRMEVGMFSKEVMENLKGSSLTRAMFEEGERLKKMHGTGNVYDFSIGNPEVEPPREVKEALVSLSNSKEAGMHRYMPNAGYIETRKVVADVSSKGLDFKVSEDQVVMTVGAAGGLNIVLKSLLNDNEEVIVLSPYFVEYLFYIKNFRGNPVIVETDEMFQPDIHAIEKAITKNTKAIILNSPNNPTGVIYSKEVLEQIDSVLHKKEKEYNTEIFVISDEPYAKISYETEVPNLLGIFKNAIVVNSFSKSLALPGERIGYVVVSPKIKDDKMLMDGMIFANRTLGYVNAPAIAQKVIQKAIHANVDIEGYKEKRDILYDALTEYGFSCIKPEGAFYLFVKTPVEDSEFVKYSTENYRIIAVPGKGFGRPGYIRLAFCVSKDTIVNSLPGFKALAKDYNLDKKAGKKNG